MLQLDLSSFERAAKRLGGAVDQVPFALATSMTSAAFKTRRWLIDETWPKAVKVRNTNFLRAALQVEPATKHNLTVAISDRLGRGHLGLHAKGGVKHAKKRLAIPPTGTVQRGPKGIPRAQKPQAIRASTPARALRVLPRGIFIGRGGRLHLAYAFATSAMQRADVPFERHFRIVMAAEMRKAYPGAMRRAMRTRRPAE
ncbi:hypothetical protein K32_24120 [Kaistia sp. 32K]|uniref:hypothetical protein n=1 Tax=Kaistia sp. 32K TaxID=2795690 RepID=UPI001915F0C7|nr:hypothetical protein [Kaistia sp. 32K]BCP53795.1 hypothetical protein K32_24120 [Kaistia sp. 32K]